MQTPGSRLFDHVLIIMFENQYRGYVQHNVYMKQLALNGIELTNYHGVMHPSQTNYVASIAGELCNVSYDERVYMHPPQEPLPQRTIVDLLEEAGLTWKVYLQNYNPQQQPWTSDLVPDDDYPYMVKHNPFASFQSIVRNQARWNCLVDEYQFWADVVTGQLPHYAWFTPNMWNDGHYVAGSRIESADPRAPQLVDQAAGWLETLFGALQFPGLNSKLPPRTLVVLTFDEAEYIDSPTPAGSAGKPVHGPNYNGPNQIYTVLLGDGIKPAVVDEGFNHYSLLKTIERNFGLGTLGKNDLAANAFDFLWGQAFRWSLPEQTPLPSSGPLVAAGCGDQLFVVSADSQGTIQCWNLCGSTWSGPQNLGVNSCGGLALAATDNGMTLVFQNADQSLSAISFDPETGWSRTPQPVVSQPTGTFAISQLDGIRLMLVYQTGDYQIESVISTGGKWAATPVSVGQKTDGTLALTQMGASLFLAIKAVGTDEINVLTYNTAEFNVVTVSDGKTNGPYNNTTLEMWSPTPFPVAQFGMTQGPLNTPLSKLPPEKIAKLKAELKAKLTPQELALLQEEIEAKFQPEPVPALLVSTASGPLAAAQLNGVIHLVHPGVSNTQVTDETFSVSGLMTPCLPVAENANNPVTPPPTPSHPPTTSNGFGTLAQASWGVPASISGVQQDSTRGMAITRVGSQLILVFQPDASNGVQLVRGTFGPAI